MVSGLNSTQSLTHTHTNTGPWFLHEMYDSYFLQNCNFVGSNYFKFVRKFQKRFRVRKIGRHCLMKNCMFYLSHGKYLHHALVHPQNRRATNWVLVGLPLPRKSGGVSFEILIAFLRIIRHAQTLLFYFKKSVSGIIFRFTISQNLFPKEN